MKKKIFSISLFVLLVFATGRVFAQTPALSFSPAQIIQGEPLLVHIEGVTNLSSVEKLTFDGKTVGVFIYQGKPAALVGIDLSTKPGPYELKAEFSDGRIFKKAIEVGEREKVEIPLGIPRKLGGNSAKSQRKLATTLVAENKSLAGVRTGAEAFWSEKFIPPLKQSVITDEYGYSRKTGVYVIRHKGVDYHAEEGTPVMAINRGVVRVAKTYRTYGKTVVVDHGLGLMSFYMHLSKINVGEGALAERGQIVGQSVYSGYAEKPHLHLSVHINGSSVDPVKFFELFR